MLKALQIKLLGNKLKSKLDINNRNKFAIVVDYLFDKDWTFDQLKELINLAKSETTLELYSKEKSLLSVLQLMSDYAIGSDLHDKILGILSHTKFSQWLYEINKLVIDNKFASRARLRNSNELMEEFKNLNLEFEKQMKDSTYKAIYYQLNLIRDKNLNSQNYKTSVPISNWSATDIKKWADKIKSKGKDCFSQEKNLLAEAISVVAQANKLVTKHTLRDTQIISTLLLLNSEKNLGRLLQVSTGEGKSTIVSIFAILQALRGHKVDIITSSPILAERDAKEKASLYKMFDLSCADNNDRSVYMQGKKPCYESDIVYGEASQFQFDTLRDEYSALGTLAGRQKDIAIVDEVDSMLIDDSSKIARLATTIAGVDQLQPIYHFIWHRLTVMQEKLLEIGGKMFLVYGKLNGIALQFADEKGSIHEISDLKAYLQSKREVDHIARPIEGDIDAFIKKELENYAKELIDINWSNDEKESTGSKEPEKLKNKSLSLEKLKIPKNFHEFVRMQLPKWLDSALTAFSYSENVHYIVQNGSIKPVDYNSTGLVQSSTNWSDGLHQFLQIKHGLKMTSETFTTNFLSNVGYFSSYGKNIYGLTGTLGSDKAKQVLQKVYNVDLATIPRSCEEQYLRLPTVSAPNREIWLQEVTTSAINEAHKGRGTLLICETIEDADEIADILRSKYRSGAVKQYTMNDMHQENEIEKIYQGDIIVATNLAGRGTDIKTEDVEAFGGMHVIVTFMPPNKRVEDQAFGRTARQGKRGTGQMIINNASLPFGNVKVQEIEKVRDELEIQSLENFTQKELKIIDIKDRLFKKFCGLVKYLRERIGTWQGIKDFVNEEVLQTAHSVNLLKTIYVGPSVYEMNIIAAVEEQWAMLLKKIDDGRISTTLAENEYKKFDSDILKRLDADLKGKKGIFSIIQNPYYHIAIANDIAANSPFLDGTYEKAKEYFKLAIEADPDFCAPAHVGKAWLMLKGKKRLFGDNAKQESYKLESLRELEEALKLVGEEMGTLGSMQAMSAQFSGASSDLSKQLIQKMNILGSYMNSIEANVDSIKRAQRRVDIIGLKTYQNTNPNREVGHGDSMELEERTDYNEKISA